MKKLLLGLVAIMLMCTLYVAAEDMYVIDTHEAKFGEVQGVDNFYYCAFNNGQETLLNLFPQSNNPSDKRWRVEAGQTPYVAFDGASPNATTDVGLMFVAPIDGQVNLTATMNFPSWIQDNTGIKEYDGDGVKAQILKNDIVVWEDTLKFKQTLSHDVSVLVEAGDKIKFVLNVNGNASYDVVQWWPTVKYVLPTSTSKFGEAQGVDNFYYCAFNNGQETLLNLFPQSNNPSDKRWRPAEGQSPAIAFDGASPNKTTDVGLMYIAPMDGAVNITGKDMTYAGWVLSNSSAQGNGVNLKILKNDTIIWEKNVDFRATASHDLVVNVAKGDKIKFIINAREDGGNDAFVWWPTVKYVLPTSTSKFGEVQGVDNFYFCQFVSGEETLLNLFPQSNNPSDKRWRPAEGQSPAIAYDGASPNKSIDVGLMYIAPMDGTVNITGKDMTYAGWVLSNSSAQGNGVNLKILKNDTIIWEKNVDFRATASHDLVVNVAKGDKIKFIINARADGGNDAFVWWPEVKYTTLEDDSALKVIKNEIDENGNYVFSCVNTTGITHNLWVFAAKKDIDGRLENAAFIPVSVPAYSVVEETESGMGLTASDEINKYIWEAKTIRPYIFTNGILTN